MEHVERLGPYSYTWDEACFPLTGDSVALAAFCALKKGWRICDLGCGAGALMALLLGREAAIEVSGVELDAHAAELARHNLPGVPVTCGDLTRRADLPSVGNCDLVISNPPYFAAGSGGNGGRARMEQTCTVEALCESAGYLLKNGGRFALCYRPERLCDLICALRAAGLEPKRVKLLSCPGKAPSVVLLEAVKRGRPGLQIEP